MDENRPAYRMEAPAARRAKDLRLPGRGEFPRVDEYLIEPATSRDEMIGGRVVQALPADPPHAFQQGDLGYVLRGKTASAYRSAIELRTRVDHDSDFATDAAILKKGTDPATGSRYLEELAFEVVSTQSRSNITEKAKRMQRRGVRRIFAIFLEAEEVAEWSPAQRRWATLDPESSIEDPCLAQPLAVAALFDAAAADDAVATALAKKGNRVIEGLKVESKAEGNIEGRAEDLLAVLDARGFEPNDAVRKQILTCTDPDRLRTWLRRAVVAPSIEAVFDSGSG